MKKSSSGTVWIIIGAVFLLAAFTLIGYNIYSQVHAGKVSRIILDNLDVNEKHVVSTEAAIDIPLEEAPVFVSSPEIEMPVKEIDGHDYIGVLCIPSLGLELPVMAQWDYDSLQLTPCRYTGSVYQNNLVICAHNYDTHFGQIKNLGYGDPVQFIDVEGKVFNYITVEQEVLEPTAIDEMTSSEWDLTLFTCTLGGTSRVTVRCESDT